MGEGVEGQDGHGGCLALCRAKEGGGGRRRVPGLLSCEGERRQLGEAEWGQSDDVPSLQIPYLFMVLHGVAWLCVVRRRKKVTRGGCN